MLDRVVASVLPMLPVEGLLVPDCSDSEMLCVVSLPVIVGVTVAVDLLPVVIVDPDVFTELVVVVDVCDSISVLSVIVVGDVAPDVVTISPFPVEVLTVPDVAVVGALPVELGADVIVVLDDDVALVATDPVEVAVVWLLTVVDTVEDV